MSAEKTFIGEVSRQVLSTHTGRLHAVTIVVPAKRALRFFKNTITGMLAETGTAAILPEIITLNDLTGRFSPYTVLTPLELSFHFYQVYSRLEKDPEPFEKFYSWAPALLADFNEVDNYLVNPDHLFRDLKNIKEIDEWSFLSGDWSQGQQKLNAFWEKLPLYYKKLNEYLVEQKLAYNGMANKYLAQNAAGIFTTAQPRYYVFAGFNALTQCEKTIMQYLESERGAQLFFDTDRYYVDHEFHEAGLFIRSFENFFGKRFRAVDAAGLLNTPKKINYYECNGEALQCAELVRLLNEKTPQELERAAIVLCNEQLLPVLIGEFPNEFLKINVTMGWPLRFTNVNDFFQALIELHIALQRNGNYVPYEQVKHFMDITASVLRLGKTTEHLEVSTYKQLLSYFNGNGLAELLQHPGDDILLFVQRVLDFIDQQLFMTDPEDLQVEVFAHFLEVFNKLSQLPGFSQHIKSWYLFKRFFQAFTRQYPLAFLGEPMSGIQVMGMLETRGLDFDQVYVLSCNEGFLPAQHNSTGFIPYELRQYVKLPGKAEQDAVFAYYFYRLLQRAGEVHLFYNGQNELLQQAEKSRYLLQIEKELVELNSQIQLESHFVSHHLPAIKEHEYPGKTPFYYSRLESYVQSGFSASMLSTYVNCPLDFYFKYILGFRQEKDPQLLEEADVGNIIHGFFQEVFTPLVGQALGGNHFRQAAEQVDPVVRQIINAQFGKYEFTSGENYLALQMIRKMIGSFLHHQSGHSATHVLEGKILEGTEIKLETGVQLGSGREVKLKGTIDLLLTDGKGNYFVYDFKTGRAAEEDLVIPARGEVVESISGKNKLLQLMIYRRLVKSVYPSAVSVQAFLIPLATGGGKFLQAPDLVNENEVLLQVLTGMIESMYSSEELLEHESKSRFCDFCF